jgi:hypothetical protein
VFFHDGVFHAFYANRKSLDTPLPRLMAATGADGVRFGNKTPVLALRAPYSDRSTRDPFVFRDPQTGLFHMLATDALAESGIDGRTGVLAHLVSRDLKNWEQRPPFLAPGVFKQQPECPEWFEWNGWYYLVFSTGRTTYRVSRSPLGPWSHPAVDTLDTRSCRVMRSAPFAGNRRAGAAWVGAGGFGGHLVFREYIQHADGSLGTKWLRETLPAAGAPAALRPAPLGPGVTAAGADITLAAPAGATAVSLGDAPANFMLKTRVRPAPGAAEFGIRLKAGAGMKGGVELRLAPRGGVASLRPGSADFMDEPRHTTLRDIAGLDAPFDLEILVRGAFVDVCIDNRRTIAARFVETDGADLYLFARDSEVVFENLEVRPLTE